MFEKPVMAEHTRETNAIVQFAQDGVALLEQHACFGQSTFDEVLSSETIERRWRVPVRRRSGANVNTLLQQGSAQFVIADLFCDHACGVQPTCQHRGIRDVGDQRQDRPQPLSSLSGVSTRQPEWPKRGDESQVDVSPSARNGPLLDSQEIAAFAFQPRERRLRIGPVELHAACSASVT